MATVTIPAATYQEMVELVTLCVTLLPDPDRVVAGESTRVDLHEPPRTRLRREADALDRAKRAHDLAQHLHRRLKESP